MSLLCGLLWSHDERRHEDDFSFSSSDSDTSNPGPQSNQVVTEGSSVGRHIFVSSDTSIDMSRIRLCPPNRRPVAQTSIDATAFG